MTPVTLLLQVLFLDACMYNMMDEAVAPKIHVVTSAMCSDGLVIRHTFALQVCLMLSFAEWSLRVELLESSYPVNLPCHAIRL